MDEKQQREFEAKLLRQQADEYANETIGTLKQHLDEGVSSAQLIARIPSDCLVQLPDQVSFRAPEWLPQEAAQEARRLWQLATFLRDVEFERTTGKSDDEILNTLHKQLSQIHPLDRIRLRLGMFEALNPFKKPDY